MPAFSSRRGQNIIEYILLVTAVMVLLITVILAKNGPFVKATDSTVNMTAKILENTPRPCFEVCDTDLSSVSCGQEVKSNCPGLSCGEGTMCDAGYTCTGGECQMDGVIE